MIPRQRVPYVPRLYFLPLSNYENRNCFSSWCKDRISIIKKLASKSLISQVVNVQEFPWVATVDGEFLTDTPYNLIRQGRFEHKNSLLGVNADEGTFWILFVLPGFSKDTPSLQNLTMFRNGVDVICWDLNEQQVRSTLLAGTLINCSYCQSFRLGLSLRAFIFVLNSVAANISCCTARHQVTYRRVTYLLALVMLTRLEVSPEQPQAIR